MIRIENLKILSNIAGASTASLKLAIQENLCTSKNDSSAPDYIAPGIHPKHLARLQEITSGYSISEDESVSTSEDITHNEIIQNYEHTLPQSLRAIKIVGQKNRLENRRFKQKAIKKIKKSINTFGTQTE